MDPRIRVSDVIAYEFCPKKFYFQRVLGIVPEKIRILFELGTEEHEIYEAENERIHSEKPEANEGEPYEILIQEKNLFDAKNNISGRIDTLYVYGSSFRSESDQRRVLIIDKKPKMNGIYHLQLFGYAHLLDSSDEFACYRPYTVFGQIVHNSGESREIHITEDRKSVFLGKARNVREHLKRMLEGEVPQPKKCARCFKCPYNCFKGLNAFI